MTYVSGKRRVGWVRPVKTQVCGIGTGGWESKGLCNKEIAIGREIATARGMKNKLTMLVWLLFLVRPAPVAAAPQDPNVNERYTVEDVQLRGVAGEKVDKSLHDDMQKLVGEKFSESATDELAKRLRKGLPDYAVQTKVRRGDKADHVKVIFELERIWWKKFDVGGSRIVYHSKQGWSGALSATIDSHHNDLILGFANSADELLERNAGIRLGYEHRKLGTDRLRFRMGFESYHEKWNPATELALGLRGDVPGIYRARQNFSPQIAVLPWRDLQLSVGTSFERLQMQYPTLHTDTAYSGTLTASYQHRSEGAGGFRQRFRADYALRSATRVLDSDFVYTRHALEAEYRVRHARNLFSVRVLAGGITGRAPLFERFSLGNSMTLRGWNKFDVAPLGGNRVAYASLEYAYACFKIFYDTGAVWDSGKESRTRHSVGFGVADRHGAFLLLGFPVRLNHVAPVVTFGIGF